MNELLRGIGCWSRSWVTASSPHWFLPPFAP
uniref:Uncharacterized protein n=1 Tax=Physcomitrium patens TaxID=3218 RepID=A0A2K1IN93_PHYPA|nr:hypothetical protein PHYPA_027056 [Physcomitrium patens]